MRASPSIVPTDRLDREIYLVLEDFGVRAGASVNRRAVICDETTFQPARSRPETNLA